MGICLPYNFELGDNNADPFQTPTLSQCSVSQQSIHKLHRLVVGRGANGGSDNNNNNNNNNKSNLTSRNEIT